MRKIPFGKPITGEAEIESVKRVIEDITGHIELNKAIRKSTDQKRINVDIPLWMIEALDSEAFSNKESLSPRLPNRDSS